MPSVGRITVGVEADGKSFIPTVKRVLDRAKKFGEAEAKIMGERVGSAFAKKFEESSSKGGGGAGGGGSMITKLLPALPLLTSLASNAAGGLTALTGSMARGATAGLSMIGVYGTMFQVMGVAKIAFGGMGAALSGNATALAKLTPAAQAFVKQLQSFKPAWDKVKSSIQNKMFAGLATEIGHVAHNMLPVLQKQLGGTAHQMNLLAKDLGTWLSSKKAAQDFGTALRGNNQIFAILRKAAVPLLHGILQLYIALQPAAKKLAGYIVMGAKAFNTWASAGRKTGSIAAYMDKAWKSAKTLFLIVKDLGTALIHVLNASANSGDSLWRSIRKVTKQFADWTGTVKGQDAIKKWAQTGTNSFRQIGKMIKAIAPYLQALFNPTLGNDFLKLITSLGPVFKQIMGVIQTALKPILSALSGPEMQKFGKDVGKLFKALSPLLKGLGAVLGQVISQALSGLSSVIELITPIVGLLSKWIGPLLQKFAPIIAFLILNFGLFGETIATKVGPVLKWLFGLFDHLGFIGKGINLLFKAYVGIFGKMVGAMKIFGKALKPIWELASAFFGNVVSAAQKLWDFLFGHSIFPDIERGIKLFVDAVKLYFDIWIALFHMIEKIISTVMHGVWNVIKNVWDWITTKFSDAVHFVHTTVVNGFDRVVNFIGNLPSRISNQLKDLASTVGGLFHDAWDAAKTKVENIAGNILTFVGNIPQKVTNVLTGAGGLLKTLEGIFHDAMDAGLTKVQTVGGDIVTWLSGLPQTILNKVTGFGAAGKALLQEFIDGMKNAAGVIAGLAGNVWTTLKGLLNGGIDKINAALEFTIKLPLGKSITINPPDIPHLLARGTRYFSGGSAIVGEKGPELVNLPRGSRVTNASQTARMLDQGGDTHVQIDQHYYGPTTGSDRRRELEWTLKYGTRSATGG